MEGISEQYIVGFVAGLAKEGFLPYVNTIANFFTRRAFEQIAMDVALHELPVRFLASGGGMVYAPLGPTHTAIDDLALMSSIPNLRIFAPGDANEMRALLNSSLLDPKPWYVRFGKGGEPNFSPKEQDDPCKPKLFGDSAPEIVFLTTGITVHEALQALKQMKEEGKKRVGLIHLPEITAIQFETWRAIYLGARRVVVTEEHIPHGGLFSRVLETVHLNGLETSKLVQQCLPFRYSHNYGNQADHLRANKLDALGLIECAKSIER
jgi:transketolase